MIGYKDIKRAVNTIIKNNFSAKINSKDVKEGFDRPSFFVYFDNVSISQYQSETKHNLTVTIYYFPKSRDSYSIELLEVQEKLSSLFDLKLSVVDRMLNIDSIGFNVVDGVLEMMFDIEFYNEKQEEDLPLMENIEMN